MNELARPLDSYPVSHIENSQPPGIGRVVAVGGMAAWNNLGRNIVFADRDLRPRAIFAETLYPEDDELSQYDLDVHAIVAVPDAGLVLTLNHLGLLRAFTASEIANNGPALSLHPLWARLFAEDVERAVIVANRLIGSSSRSSNGTGLVVSEPLDRSACGDPLATRAELESWGEVTALAAVDHCGEPAVAVGGPGRVSLVPLAEGRAGRARWDVDVPFRAAVFVWKSGVLWAAGSGLAAGIGDYEWEKVRGGGVVALDPRDGRVIFSAPLPDDIAWGNGGAPFAVLGGLPCAVGRSGALYVAQVDLGSAPGDGGNAWRSSSPTTSSSLGIAHATVAAQRLLYGFNRGGYRLHAVARSAIERLASSEQ